MDFSPFIEKTVRGAFGEAKRENSDVLGTPHLFIVLTKLNGITTQGLRVQGQDPKRIRDGLRTALGQGRAAAGTEPKLTVRAAQNLQQATKLAEAEGASQVEEQHLLIAILEDDPGSLTLRTLSTMGVDLVALRPDGSSGTPILDRLGRDLTSLAGKGDLDPLIGRHEQLRQLVRTLARKKKNNPVLIGLAGVGKTAIVEGLAKLIVLGQVPEELQGCRLVELPMAAVVAGTTYRGQFEERLLGLVNEVKRADNIILFIDEIHTILRAGAVEGGALDAGNILKPALARGDLRVIGATTPEEYQRYIASDAALERRFQPVSVPEPRPEEALQMLRGVKARYETHHGVTIADEALEAAVELSVVWLQDRYLPDKALDLMDEACSRARFPTISKPAERGPGLVVTARTVAEVLGDWQGISADEVLKARIVEFWQLTHSCTHSTADRSQTTAQLATRLFPLESLTGKPQRPTVLGDGAHDVIRRAGRDLGLDLDRHRDPGADQAGKMGDDLVGDPAGVAPDAGGVEGDSAVETLGPQCRGGQCPSGGPYCACVLAMLGCVITIANRLGGRSYTRLALRLRLPVACAQRPV